MPERFPRAHGFADRRYDRQFFFVFFFFFHSSFLHPLMFLRGGGREALAFFDGPAGRAILFAAAQEWYDSPAAHGRAEEIVARLCAAAGETQDVQIIVRAEDHLNAYALPGRIIVLNAPALSLPEGELAALLARMESAYGAVSHANSHLSWAERRAIFCDDADAPPSAG